MRTSEKSDARRDSTPNLTSTADSESADIRGWQRFVRHCSTLLREEKSI